MRTRSLAYATLTLTLFAGLTACSTGNSATWTPSPYPSAQANGLVPPTGPQLVEATISNGETSYKAEGYIDITQNLSDCSLDLKVEETKETGETVSGNIVKAPGEPAYYQKENETVWYDTRNIAAPASSLFLISNPFGIAFTAEENNQSLCYLTSFPYITNETTPGKYDWNPASLAEYVTATNHTFINAVLKNIGADAATQDQLAKQLSEAAPKDAGFTKTASPITVTKTAAPDVSTTISYTIGQNTTVNIRFTPTPSRVISAPETAAPWNFDMVEAMGNLPQVKPE